MNTERLLYLRENKDLTQEQLGKILGVSKYSISKWENGKETISLPKLNEYSNYFNVSMDYILNISEVAKNSNSKVRLSKVQIPFNKEINKKEIGENIKKVREKNGLTQGDLAKVLNTTHSAICAYEKGKTTILTSFAYQICKSYSVSMDWLCGRK